MSEFRSSLPAVIIVSLMALATAFIASHAKGDPPITLVMVDKPEQVPAAVNGCKNNCLVRLKPGVYGPYDLRNMRPQPGKVTIDYTGSSFTLMRFAQSSNLTVVGGEVINGNQWGQCWMFDDVQGFVVMHVSALRCGSVGFGITRSRDIVLTDWASLDGMCDGVTVSGTDGFVVAGGLYHGYFPNPNGCHADGVQMWGMDGFPLTNGQVINNDLYSTGAINADGRSMGIQGITAFGNNAPGGGAFPQSNITVSNNRMYLNGSWCVAIFNTTNVTAKDNRCVDEVPRPWNSNYGWNGSTGAIGPNYLNNIAQSYTPPANRKPSLPPTPPVFTAGADQHQ